MVAESFVECVWFHFLSLYTKVLVDICPQLTVEGPYMGNDKMFAVCAANNFHCGCTLSEASGLLTMFSGVVLCVL